MTPSSDLAAQLAQTVTNDFVTQIEGWTMEPKDMDLLEETVVAHIAAAIDADREAVRREVLEEAAKVADGVPKYVNTSPAHIRFTGPPDAATAIRSLATRTEAPNAGG